MTEIAQGPSTPKQIAADNDDSNRNRIPCDVLWTRNADGSVIQIQPDMLVDEDPVDSELMGESSIGHSL